jgi:hypothetical protein
MRSSRSWREAPEYSLGMDTESILGFVPGAGRDSGGQVAYGVRLAQKMGTDPIFGVWKMGSVPIFLHFPESPWPSLYCQPVAADSFP